MRGNWEGEAPVSTFTEMFWHHELTPKIFVAVPRHCKWKIPHLCFPVESPDVYIVERLFSSSLVVVVSLSMPRRMNVYHFKKGTEICNYSYSNNILSVRLNRQVRTGDLSRSEGVAPALGCPACVYLLFLLCLSKRLVVCLEESVYIHNIKDMKLLKTLLNTPTNLSGTMRRTFVFKLSEWSFPGVLFIPRPQCHYMLACSDSLGLDGWEAKCSFTCPLCCVAGLCALSVNHSNSYLAYPGSATIGEITLYDANNLVRIQFAVHI